MQETQRLVILTHEQINEVLDAAQQGDVAKAIHLTYLAFGVDLRDDDCPTVRPSDYALPSNQWKAICQALMESTDSTAIGKVNHGLTWMNIGPSSRELAK